MNSTADRGERPDVSSNASEPSGAAVPPPAENQLRPQHPEDVERARAHLHSLFMQAPAPIIVMRGPEHHVELVNAPYLRLVGCDVRVGRPLRETFPELESQGIFDILDGVYASGTPFEGKELPVLLRASGEERFFNFVYQPMRGTGGDVEGIMTFAYDVTEQVRARQQETRAAAFLQQRQKELALSAEMGVAFAGALSIRDMLHQCAEAMVRHLDAAFARIWTLEEGSNVLELQASAGQYTHLDGPHARVPVGQFKIGLIAREAKPHLTNDVQQDSRVGDREWAKREGMVSFAGYPLIVDSKVIGVMAMFSRVPLKEGTLSALNSIADSIAVGIQRKRAEARAHEESETLDILNKVGQFIAAELDTDKLVQAITDSATRLTGAQFGAFFYNVVDDRGEAYTLYTISGVPREAFSKFPMPRNTKVFAPTFAGEGVVRVANIRKDPRYGQNPPYHGMPSGHLPVVSYLAVPVVSRDGRVIGGLFFGHGKEGVFTERAERLAVGVAAQASIAMDNASLFREAQRLIRALERSNQDLDQFAYVTSHDLKAPLRGIANLSQWIEEDLGAALSADSRKHLDLMRRRVHRMDALIDGILQYSRAGRVRGMPETLEVGRLLQELVELVAPRPPAMVELQGELPVLFTERVPLQQVLMNLITNALKHARREDARVVVSAVEDGDFCRFTVTDNGPGIAPEFHERIWGIFQTLEARDKVEGTGIGLAVVKKVVESRGGKAWVESAAGAGARFHFTWPMKERAA
ncbi:GAF domain-containing protein [Pyxidicoccus caerfyrddinensis]|uniref:GAF domain-containing protein n=1 Tax=Pyxidicoccus caerfyrddinensis TaxID=2709663 RepID=UPI0013DBAEDE|nr:GAF domain-containing protein [Pyxidicoccus caerfyrddinensis]